MATWRDRGATALLVVVLVVLAGATVYEAVEVSVRLRVDTPVSAEARGEPGCLTSAVFTDPSGRQHAVDLRVYKANCLDGDPGDRVTVWYDASDPAVNSRSRSWWWPALLMLPGLLLVGLAVRTALRRLRGLPEPPAPPGGPSPAARVREAREPAADDRDAAVGIIHREQDAHLVHDYALGRLEVLLEEVDAERTTTATDRRTAANDQSLTAVRDGIVDTAAALRGGETAAAERRYRGLMRLVVDEWDQRSPLAGRLLGFGRNIFG